jgi:hypothetical protein
MLGPHENDAVTELLGIVEPGLEGQYSPEQRRRIDELLETLDRVGNVCMNVCVSMYSNVCMFEQAGTGGSFLDDESINDYYRVQYTRDAARGNPVGGAFRYSALGRAFFRTEDAYQHVLGQEAINMLYFTFAGFCPGCIVLRGQLQRCSADERAAVEAKYRTPPPGLSAETIKVTRPASPPPARLPSSCGTAGTFRAV